MTGSWEHFPHGADIGVRGRGPTREAAFAEAALALTAVMTDPSRVGEVGEPVDLEVRAADDEGLLVAWLDALIYETAVRKRLFGRFEVRLEPGRLFARAFGAPVDVGRHRPVVEVKGATWTELRVARESDGSWTAQCVVDV